MLPLMNFKLAPQNPHQSVLILDEPLIQDKQASTPGSKRAYEELLRISG